MSDRYRVLAIDYGTKRIGLAVSDEMRMLASGRGVIENTNRVRGSIEAMVRADGIKRIVIGIPLTLKNTDSAMTAEARAFKAKLAQWMQPLGVEVVERDERLTSMMANSHIAGSSLPKHRKESKGLRDEEAARILLQEYLDSIP